MSQPIVELGVGTYHLLHVHRFYGCVLCVADGEDLGTEILAQVRDTREDKIPYHGGRNQIPLAVLYRYTDIPIYRMSFTYIISRKSFTVPFLHF